MVEILTAIVSSIVILAVWTACQQGAMNDREKKTRVLRRRVEFLEEKTLTKEQQTESRAANVVDGWYY